MNQQTNRMIGPALIGGVFLGITSSLPIINLVNCACCLWVVGGGVLAVYLYTRNYPSRMAPVTYTDGALLGLLTGVFGGLVWTAVDVPLAFLWLQFDATNLAELQEVLQDAGIPSEVRELILTAVQSGGTGLGVILFNIGIHVLLGSIFATLGGILGIALFGDQTRPQVSPEPPAVPPQSGTQLDRPPRPGERPPGGDSE